MPSSTVDHLPYIHPVAATCVCVRARAYTGMLCLLMVSERGQCGAGSLKCCQLLKKMYVTENTPSLPLNLSLLSKVILKGKDMCLQNENERSVEAIVKLIKNESKLLF